MLPEIEEIGRKRKRFGLTQKNLATLAGVSQSIIAKIESNKVNPSYGITKRIFDVLENIEVKNQITAKQIFSSKLVCVNKNETVAKAVKLMRTHGYSQVPVCDRGQTVGSISEKTILDIVSSGENLSEVLNKKVQVVMDDAMPRVSENEPLPAISTLLQSNPAVLVTRKGKTIGIITKADLLKVPSTH